jgi:hypothetical protein
MGFVLTIIFSFFVGLLFLAGWVSIDAIWDCAPLSGRVANGTLGLFCVGGACLGIALQIVGG